MGTGDPLDTASYPTPPVAELRATGFDDAREIGRGGFGVVYRCIQTPLDRTVAVNVLLVELDEKNRERFFREQRAMGRLTGHPNIVTVLQVGATNSGLSYIVMPYHQQDSLDVRIRDHGPLPLPEALRLGVKMAGAVETAHQLGILHRDIKPANILLTDYGEPARPWPTTPRGAGAGALRQRSHPGGEPRMPLSHVERRSDHSSEERVSTHPVRNC